MSKPEIEALGVLFQADDALTYVDTMMQRIVAATSQTVPAQGGVE